MRLLFVTCVLIVSVPLSGCSQDRQSSKQGSAVTSEAPLQALMSQAAPSRAPAPAGESWSQRKLIRTGNLGIEVGNVEKAIDTVRGIARTFSGYLTDSRVVRNDEGRLRSTVTVQIPSEHFDEAMAALKKIGRVRSEAIETEDVTKAYFDLETRLRVKRDTESRLRDLLSHHTGRLSDVLAVERELDRVVGEIEAMEGERKYFDQRIAVSTIVVDAAEPGALIQTGGLATIRTAIRESLNVLSTSVAGLIYVVIFALPWAVVGWLTWRVVAGWRRRRRVRAGGPEPPPVSK